MHYLPIPHKVISVVLLISLVFILGACGRTNKDAHSDDGQLLKNEQNKESLAPASDKNPGDETDKKSSAAQNNGADDTTPDKPQNGGEGTTGDELRQEVLIKDFVFEPAEIKVKPGTTIVWNNQDAAAHEIHTNIRDYQRESFGQGESFEIDFISPGTYNYHCHIHPRMSGTIIVE